MGPVAIVLATFGDLRWAELAAGAAKRSAEIEEPDDLVVFHGGDTIAEARNRAAGMTDADWLVFLDADDELEPGYLAAIRSSVAEHGPGLYAPAVRFVPGSGEIPAPTLLADRNILTLNPCVIGTAIRAEVFHDVGGFAGERAWEDWSLFRRAHLAGEAVRHVPGAVYRVNVNPAGRNSTIANPKALHHQIVRAHARWLAQRRKARR